MAIAVATAPTRAAVVTAVAPASTTTMPNTAATAARRYPEDVGAGQRVVGHPLEHRPGDAEGGTDERGR